MNVDSGMFRRLPPYQPDNTEAPKIAKRNILQILVNKDNLLSVNGEILDVNRLKKEALDFILNPANDEDLPEKSVKEIEGLGNVEVSKGVISLQSDKGTSYEMYIAVQDQLAAAFNEARDRKAVSKWGKKYNDLNSDQQEAIKKWVPMSISEAEPKNIGGKKK